MTASEGLSTTDDLFLGGALTVRQPKSGYRAGLDAVLLAAACPAVADQDARCLDCGAGAGVAGLAAAWRVNGLAVVLIERDPGLAALAKYNSAVNGLGDRTDVIIDDLTRPLSQMTMLHDRAGTFDHALANPPFHHTGSGTPAPDRLKDASHAMAAGAFEQWARFAAAMLRPGGSYTIVQRPEALPEILRALDRRFGRVRVLPLHGREGEPASRMLVQAVKGSRAGLQLLPSRILHVAGTHAFTPEFDAVLRDGKALVL